MCVKAVSRINQYWKELTDYKQKGGRDCTADIYPDVVDGSIILKAQCTVCKHQPLLNMVRIRDITIANYKKLAAVYHVIVDRVDGKTSKRLKSTTSVKDFFPLIQKSQFERTFIMQIMN